VVTADEVISIMNKLKPNKQDGNESLSSNHFCNAGVQLHIHTSCLFSGILVHGYIPDVFLSSTTLPIPTGCNSNLKGHSYKLLRPIFLVRSQRLDYLKLFCNIFHQKNMNAYN